MDVFVHGLYTFTDMMWWGRFSLLSVIGKRVLMSGVIFNYIRDGCGIQDKQNRPKDRVPKNTIRSRSRIKL